MAIPFVLHTHDLCQTERTKLVLTWRLLSSNSTGENLCQKAYTSHETGLES